MADHFNAARELRERDETAQRNGSRRSRRAISAERDILDEGDLAEFEALLMRNLKRSPSPSIAAEDDAGEQPVRDSEPVRRHDPLGRAPHKLKRPSSTEFGRRPAPEPRLARTLDRLDDRPPLAPMRRDDRRSLVTRAMGIAATLFSLVALLAVSALLVLLAVGGEWPATPAAEESARVSQFADTAERAPVPPPATEIDLSPAVTGSIEAKLDASRIPSQGYTGRPVGTVRAVHTQDVSTPTPQPTETSPPAASQQFAPTYFSAAPAAVETAAPTETATTETGNRGVERARRPSAAPAAATRSAPVTTHVNLRAKPENDAAVVAVVPAKQNVKVVECTRWCKVVYGDKQGFVHRRFLSGAGG